MNCLYILEICLSIIFSHSEGCLFTLLIVSFAMQKLLSLKGPTCLLLFLFPLLQEVDHRRILLWFVSSGLPMFYSKSFIVYGITFRSIHFEFIFVYGVRKCSNFILLHVAVQFSQHHLLKRLYLPRCIFLSPLPKIRYL